MDKTKFVRDPQLDAEGFTMLDAPCRGCGPCEPCPRSGHCERYSSPLRYLDHAVPQIMLADVRCMGCAPIDAAWTPSETDVLYREITGRNPPGWDEVDGVKLPSVSPWAQLDQSQLDAVHTLWSAGKVEPQLSNEAMDCKINALLAEHGYPQTAAGVRMLAERTLVARCPRTDACAKSAGKVEPQPNIDWSNTAYNKQECPRTDACANLHHVECGCIATGDE